MKSLLVKQAGEEADRFAARQLFATEQVFNEDAIVAAMMAVNADKSCGSDWLNMHIIQDDPVAQDMELERTM